MEIKQGKPFQMLPPGPGKCPICAEKEHSDDFPHNRDSLFYQFWFQAQYGRSPTWADAALLCPEWRKASLLKFLKENNVAPEKIGNLVEEGE